MRTVVLSKLSLAAILVLSSIACTKTSTSASAPNESEKTTIEDSNIEFIAFGDGGYSLDYPKTSIFLEPKSKEEFIAAERKDWLEEHRPLEEFDHAPIHVYPGTNIAAEKSGAFPVGQAMAKLCLLKRCQFGVQLGDNIYPDGADANDGKDDQQRMDDLILAPLAPLFRQQPAFIVYSALGNHDWNSSRKGVALQTAWMQEQANFHMDTQGYYSYKKGISGQDVEFFVLDTNMLLSGQTFYEVPLNPDGSEQSLEKALADGNAELEDFAKHETPMHGEDLKQLAWLEKGLTESTAKWKIVYGHHILWSIGGTKYDEGHVLRRLIMPTLCEHADAYIAGHEHDLELLTDDCSSYSSSANSQNSKPLPLIISGAASKMRGTHTPFSKWQSKRYPQVDLVWNKAFIWGFAHLKLNNQNNKLKVSFYTTPKSGSGELVAEQSFSFDKR